jgi:hypothetical protein
MRSVIGAISLRLRRHGRHEIRGDANTADADASSADFTRLLPWSGTGVPDPHARQGRTSLFGNPTSRPVVTKKARSVVALSRVARGERAAPVRLRLPVAGARKQVLP